METQATDQLEDHLQGALHVVERMLLGLTEAELVHVRDFSTALLSGTYPDRLQLLANKLDAEAEIENL